MMKHAWIGGVLTFCAIFATASAQTPAPNPPLPPLDQLVAPVALYPDALLAQVLTCAASPGQVTDMNAWVQQNPTLHGTALQDAAQQRGYEASFVALALFPDVLNQLASQIDWTTELGTAFLSDPKGVMDAVQRLRAQAQAAGNLQTTPQQVVNTETQNGQPIIVIQPANPQVVYVPVYNPQLVYWPPPPGAVLFSFGLGIAIGAMVSNNNYYAPYGWGAWGMGWHSHTVVCVGRPWVPPPHARYPYVRPVPVPYGGYRPRPYVYAPTTINVNRTTVNRSGYPGYPGGVTPRPTPYQPVARPPATQPPGAGRPPAGTAPAVGARPTTYPSGAGAAQGQRPAPSNTRTADYGSRGYSAPTNIKPSERAQTSSNAFSGYQSGSAERAASQRGQGSVSHKQGNAPGSKGGNPGSKR